VAFCFRCNCCLPSLSTGACVTVGWSGACSRPRGWRVRYLGLANSNIQFYTRRSAAPQPRCRASALVPCQVGRGVLPNRLS